MQQRTHSDNNKNDHQGAFGNSTGFVVFVLRDEEQGSQAELLDVQPDEDMLKGFGEEKASSVARSRLLELPEEKVLVEHEEKNEGNAGEAINDRRDDGISDG